MSTYSTQDHERDWTVIVKPNGFNPHRPSTSDDKEKGRNECGVVIYLTDGRDEVEHSRVLFVRRHAVNRSATFKSTFREQLAAAAEAADEMNHAHELVKEAMATAAAKRRERLSAASAGAL